MPIASASHQGTFEASACSLKGTSSIKASLDLDPAQLVQECILRHIQEGQDQDAFYVADLGEVTRLWRQWKAHLPQVLPHYAVKCSSDPGLLSRLALLGSNFDCASIQEITMVLSLNIAPTRIIFAHPVKSVKAIQFAQEHGVMHMTCDNAEELDKIATHFPKAKLYLRIAADDPGAFTRLSSKFGASISEGLDLLALAQRLGLEIVGIAFHVGSGSANAQAYIAAIEDAKRLVVEGRSWGHDIRNLDIGGGFTQESFPVVAPKIQGVLVNDKLLSSSDFRIIAEPGRYMVFSAMTLACNVIGRRPHHSSNDDIDMLYINDGLFSSFLNLAFERPKLLPWLIRRPGRLVGKQWPHCYSVWGPTCDSNDIISLQSEFPEEVKIGDWIYFEDFGAYTQSTATSFNGFPPTQRVLYVDSEATEGHIGIEA